jgi:hypothetical protein
MTRKLISIGTATLMFAGMLILLTGTSGCGSLGPLESDNISERPQSGPTGFLYQGTGRRDER